MVIEFIEQRPLLMALPGMASRFHKYYHYTPQELMDLQKKRKAHEQGGTGSSSSGDGGALSQDSTRSNSNSSIAAAGAGGGGVVGGTSAGQASHPGAVSCAAVMPLQEAVERPFGEAFLWAAGWDPRHPPLGGKPPKTSMLLTSNQQDWRRARANNSHSGGWQERYSYSPATLVAEAVRQRMEEI